MTKFRWLIFSSILCPLLCLGQDNNDFYGRSPVKNLTGPIKIEVAGEVTNPGPVDLSKLPRHSLITRETRIEKGAWSFVGAYRYEGYSLFDVLKDKIVAKKNRDEFRPVIDLLVSIENGKGEKVVVSWGEIYYPMALDRILIADRVSPIIPSESKDEWPLPDKMKLVCGNDALTERNIDEPVKITVFTAPVALKTVKGQRPLFSPGVKLYKEGKDVEGFRSNPAAAEKRTYPAVFYGRGMGFHGFQNFSGVPAKQWIKDFFPLDAETIRRGYFVFAAADGYRASITFSELINRNDQEDFLLVDRGEKTDGGRFSLYPSVDFFSDRAVKALTGIYFLKN